MNWKKDFAEGKYNVYGDEFSVILSRGFFIDLDIPYVYTQIDKKFHTEFGSFTAVDENSFYMCGEFGCNGDDRIILTDFEGDAVRDFVPAVLDIEREVNDIVVSKVKKLDYSLSSNIDKVNEYIRKAKENMQYAFDVLTKVTMSESLGEQQFATDCMNHLNIYIELLDETITNKLKGNK